MAVPHRRPVTILREAAAVVLIRPYKTILQPGVFLRVAVAVHAAIPAAVAVAVPLVRPVAEVAVLQEEDRYSINRKRLKGYEEDNNFGCLGAVGCSSPGECADCVRCC